MNIVRGIFNRILHIIVRFSPGATTIRPFLHKLRGVKIYGKVYIGEDVYIENEHPECVELHHGSGIALRSTIIAHTRGVGKVIIGKNANIFAGCMVIASANQILSIGEGAVLAAGSVVTSDVQPYTFVGGVPAKPIAHVTVPLTWTPVLTSIEDFKKGLVSIKKN
jgi:acetyltransferase-like isoleucine patch superfamily enzyme